MWWKKKKTKTHIEFDEILLDSSNIPSFNQARMEGRIELPITKRNVFTVGLIFGLIALIYFGQVFRLQIIGGEEYRERSERNSVDKDVIIAERGVIYDRNGEMLAWNEHDYTDQYDFPVRAYTDRQGLGQTIGYVSYPQKDSRGFYYRTEYVGVSGLEQSYDEILRGQNGEVLVEVDATNEIISSHAIMRPYAGGEVVVSIDAELSEAMHDIISTSTAQAGFRSGAGAIMNVHTGEIIAMTSFPSYDPEVMSDGDDVELIESYNNDDRFPFLNKVVAGAYTPGSIVKPFLAYAALAEEIISPNKTIVSNGYILLPNPYDPSNPTRFNDWRVQGEMTMREAIAFSSNVYFYIIGGGFEEQIGLGITKISEYVRKFGLGEKTGIILGGEQAGTVPDPEWKQKVFEDDWRLGDTYHTSIGQFGFQTTPLQMLRAYAAIANGGKLYTPHLRKDVEGDYIDLELNPEDLKVIHEGMRMTVNYDRGTARSLERSDVEIAAKSGTAEVGAGNKFVNSWAAGFWPYEDPDYAFILLMDRAPRSNALGATTIMGQVVEWMSHNRPEMLGIENVENKDE